MALREEGSIVHTLCLRTDGSGTYRVDLSSASSIIRLLIVLSLGPIDRARLHYVDDFLPVGKGRLSGPLVQLLQSLLWIYFAVRTGRRFAITSHEFSEHAAFGDRSKWSRKVLFAAASEIEFHTAIERMQFEKVLPKTTRKNRVVPHLRSFRKSFEGTQADARLQLGLPANKHILLCIGFIQPHKRFDMAIAAFSAARPKDAELYIVGSVRHPTQANLDYRDTLDGMAKATPNVRFVDAFVDDEAFDAWISACDMVILPYAEIWTSGVLGRAMLYSRPVAMHDHATLREQAADYKTLVFKDNEELKAILSTAARADHQLQPPPAALSARPRVLLVAPLYGPMHRGGAERVIHTFSDLLSRRYDVEVWASKSSRLEGRDDTVTDEPSRPSLRVRRFRTNVRSEFLFRMAHTRVANARRGSIWQWLWARTSISGVGMRQALKVEQDRFDAILLPHYFYGSTHRCVGVAPAKTILHPFLHDEPAIRTRVIARLFGAASLVTLNSEAENEAARNALTLPVFRSKIIGNVVAGPTADLDLAPYPAALAAHGHSTPYLIYFGRMVEEKNVGLLARWFVESKSVLPPDTRLVMVGEGPANSAELGDREIIRLSNVSEAEKWRLLSNSIALVQLSMLESFSLVTLEAWLAGRPVIVHRDCRATTRHVEACGGGFSVSRPDEFAAAVRQIADNPNRASDMASAGKCYVLGTYSETAVQARLEGAIDAVVRRCEQDRVLDVSAPVRHTGRARLSSRDRHGSKAVGDLGRGS